MQNVVTESCLLAVAEVAKNTCPLGRDNMKMPVLYPYLLYVACTQRCVSESITDSSFQRRNIERTRRKLGDVRDLDGMTRAALSCATMKSRP